MAKLELFGGTPQVPANAGLLIGNNDQTGDQEIYLTISTYGPPFGNTPSLRPFKMEDGELYGSALRDILQHEFDHGGENCLNTQEALEGRAQDAEFVAFFLEEFAAKFHQKAIHLKRRSIEVEDV